MPQQAPKSPKGASPKASMKSKMKNMFRSKDRRKIMRQRSSDSMTGASKGTAAGAASGAGTDQPTQPAKPQAIPPAPPIAQPVPQPNAAATLATGPPQAAVPMSPGAAKPAPAAVSPGVAKPVQAPPPPLTRRSTLHRTTASLAQYRATPITKHYSLNNQILAAFESHYENKLYTVAYAIGLQFVETALLEIPKHGYFYSNRHTQDRTTNSLNAIRVSNMLQQILDQQQNNPTEDFGMDLTTEFAKVQKLANLALEQAEEKSMEEYEQNRAKLEAELNEMRKQEAPTLLGEACGPLLDSFTENMCPPTLSPVASGLHKPKPDEGADSKPDAMKQEQAPPGTHAVPGAIPMPPGPPGAIPPPPPKERTVSSMMREMMTNTNDLTPPAGVPPPPPPPPGAVYQGNNAAKPDPPSLHPSVSAIARASINHGTMVPGPPPLEGGDSGGGWMVVPEMMPDRPEFGRQMSGRTYADHVALQRALYLSGLEVQPDLLGAEHVVVVPEEDDEQWMLEHALKESEREMEKLRQQEELQILQACQQSEKQQYQQQPATVAAIQPQEDGQQGEAVPGAPQLQRRVTKSRLEIETLHMLYHEDFVSLWNSGRVRVTHVHTYQGKNPGSTNGCTVIAPLLCIHHFINFAEPSVNGGQTDDPGLPDDTVKSVIDEEVPSILPKVREELGVVQDAFLIPSDSHDYLLKNQLLSQDQFVTCIGGNILDERHLNELIRTLVDGQPPENSVIASDPNAEAKEESEAKKEENAEENKEEKEKEDEEEKEEEKPPPKKRDLSNAKIACTLFFHEHVVSILKLRRAHGVKAWFDIIDSLPSRQMLSREVEKGPAGHNNIEGVEGGGPVDEFGFALDDVEEPMNCARIRCLDEEALQAALRWYACARFNSENLNYIDTYPWDDKSTDFDPRVFQAFVWTEAA